MIPLVAPCITAADRGAMLAAVSDGSLFDETTVRRFEEAFAAYIGCEWAVAVNSGTNAISVALEAAHEDVFVSIPSWSCVAIRNAAELRGHHVEYVDTDWNIQKAYASILQPVTIALEMFGRAVEMPLGTLIEDYTLSLGGVDRLFAKLGVCSFNADKMISTGRGGIIFGNGDGMHMDVHALVNYDQHPDLFGFSVAMSPMQAALGLSQLRQLPRFIQRRQELAAQYTTKFRPAGIDCPDHDCGSVFFRYLISVDWPKKAVERLAEHGIEAGRGVYPPLHQLAGLPDSDFPGTMAAVNSLLSVPVHPSITDKQVDHIIESVLKVCAP